jgi:hypothetical protein
MNTEEKNLETTNEKPTLEQPTIVGEQQVDMSKVSIESRGEMLVGLTFNPSKDSDVDTVKRACAYMIDVIEKHRENCTHDGSLTTDKEFLMNHAIGEIINAQMNVVKVITFK